MQFDCVIHDGKVCTARECVDADIGILDGRIAAVGERLAGGDRRIDAGGRLVLPGGIETHAHIAQESSTGLMTADDYRTGSISAAFGGNTCIVPFAAQHRGQTIADVLSTYDERAQSSVLDYSYHLIVSDPSPEVLESGLPMAFARGVTSFKVFMTYDMMKVSDAQFLDILTVAGTHGAITMVHAENDAMVKWMNARLLADGNTAPKFHAVSRPELAEVEAIHRAVSLSKLAGAPLFVVHVSTIGGAEVIARERAAGAAVFAETCPQYLAFTRDNLDLPGQEGAKFICSPPVRDSRTQAALWDHIKAGTFNCVSSDHAPYRFDETGKLSNGPDAPYPKIANGMPGIAARLPYLFSEGVVGGRLSASEFVALTASNAARVFGLDKKGDIAEGMDADIVLWNPDTKRTVRVEDQHDNMDYTPYDGLELTGVPETVLGRGSVIVERGTLYGKPGDGRFVARLPYDARAHGHTGAGHG
ncbi:MAG: dihydropyrimidinase [Pseudomonadota bacterium]